MTQFHIFMASSTIQYPDFKMSYNLLAIKV